MQTLFEYFSKEHNLILHDTEIGDIIDLVRKNDGMYAQNAHLRTKENAFNIAVEMRAAQREYFKKRGATAMQKSIALEKKFDALAESILTPKKPSQTDLFC